MSEASICSKSSFSHASFVHLSSVSKSPAWAAAAQPPLQPFGSAREEASYWRVRKLFGGDDGGGDGDNGGDEGGGGEGGSQASCSMLLTGLHPPAPPPHRTTQRWLPSEQVTLTFDFQPCALHWKQTKALASDPSGVHFPGEQVLEHGMSSTPAITYGVPRRSITPSPRVDSAPPQSNADAT